jgi:hypothetical protein
MLFEISYDQKDTRMTESPYPSFYLVDSSKMSVVRLAMVDFWACQSVPIKKGYRWLASTMGTPLRMNVLIKLVRHGLDDPSSTV